MTFFVQPFILYGFCLYFNFLTVTALIEHNKPYRNQKWEPGTNPTQPAAQPSCICQSLGKTISRIFGQRLSRVCLWGPNKRDAPPLFFCAQHGSVYFVFE